MKNKSYTLRNTREDALEGPVPQSDTALSIMRKMFFVNEISILNEIEIRDLLLKTMS